jgi:hypothetical protein
MAEDCCFFRQEFRIGVTDGKVMVLKKGGVDYVCLRQCYITAIDLGLNVSYRKFCDTVKGVDSAKVATPTQCDRACMVAIGALGASAPTAILVGARTLYRGLRFFKDGALPMRMVLKDLTTGNGVLKAVPSKVGICAHFLFALEQYVMKGTCTHCFCPRTRR